MKKTSRKLVVPLIVLALGIAIISTAGAVENFGQKPGQGPIVGHNNNPGFGQKPGNDDFRFNPGHKPDNDFNQWDKKGHDFKPGFHGYWNYPYKPYNWYKWYWYYPSWNHHPDHKRH